MIKYLYKDTFAVIGKMGQGEADNFNEWGMPLWDAYNAGAHEIEGLVRKNEGGAPLLWAALNDVGESNKRWGEAGFSSSGKYMAGGEADIDVTPPDGWSKWIIPAQTYIVVTSTAAEVESVYAQIADKHGSKIVGSVHAFFPEPGNDNIVDTYIPIASGMIFCQSCYLPLVNSEDFGREANGEQSIDYCCYCYQDGAFSNPNESLEEMIESCAPYVVEGGYCPDNDSARKMLQECLPTLKRWKKTGMIISFKLKEGVSEADFLVASDKIQEHYLSKRKGFITRQLMLIDGVWTDWLIWETMADAKNSMGQSYENESAKEFTSLIGEVIEQQLYPLERSY